MSKLIGNHAFQISSIVRLRRRRGFVLGTTVFFIVAVGTFATLDGLFFVALDILELEIGSDGFQTFLLVGSAILVILTIAVPVVSTRLVLRKFP